VASRPLQPGGHY